MSHCLQVNNNQENNRILVSATVDERTEFELYYPPFEAAARAGVWSVMCSYNLINGVYACENAATLAALKERFNFSGWVMSDWVCCVRVCGSGASWLFLVVV